LLAQRTQLEAVEHAGGVALGAPGLEARAACKTALSGVRRKLL
jgi:hypothetical protein